MPAIGVDVWSSNSRTWRSARDPSSLSKLQLGDAMAATQDAPTAIAPASRPRCVAVVEIPSNMRCNMRRIRGLA